jgi:hypothetical protein
MMDIPADRLKKARIDAGYATATDAARAMGMKPPTYLGHENGTTGLRRGAAIRYAKFYGLSLDWLLTGAGQGGASRHVPVVGTVGAGGVVQPVEGFPKGHGVDQVEPPATDNDCVAVRISGDGMAPLRDGWLLFYRRDTDGVPKDCIGELCIVQVKNGPVLLRVVDKASHRGQWRLESWNAGSRQDANLSWASKVIDIRPDRPLRHRGKTK